jgi:MFS family permease
MIAQDRLAVPARRAGDFWLYWAGQTISLIGSALTSFALPLLVFKLSGSALDLGLSTAAAWLPYVVFGLPIGTWVDRINRKGLMISMDIVRAALLAVVPTLALVGHLPLWWIYVVLFFNATLGIGFNAAGYAAIASLAKSKGLVRANGYIQTSAWLALVIGPLLATFLLTRISLQGVLWVDAASFLVSAAMLVLVRTSFNRASPRTETETETRSAFGRDLVEGLHYVLSHPLLRALGLIALLANLALGTIVAQLVLVAKDVFAASDAQVAGFATALGIGGAVASLLAGPLKRIFPYGVLLLGSLLLFGVLTIVLVLTHSYWAGVVLWGCMFGMIGFFDVAFPAIIQAVTPDAVLGRVTTVLEMLAVLSVPLSAVLGGWIIDRVGNVSLVFGILGGFVALVALVFMLSPLAHVERYLPPAPEVAGETVSAQ